MVKWKWKNLTQCLALCSISIYWIYCWVWIYLPPVQFIHSSNSYLLGICQVPVNVLDTELHCWAIRNKVPILREPSRGEDRWIITQISIIITTRRYAWYKRHSSNAPCPKWYWSSFPVPVPLPGSSLSRWCHHLPMSQRKAIGVTMNLLAT